MKTIKNNLLLLKIAGKEGRGILAFRIFRSFVDSVKMVLLSLVIPASALNAIATHKYTEILVLFCTLMVLELIDILVLNWVEKNKISRLQIEMADNITLSLFKHSSEIDMSCFDDKTFYDKNILAINNIASAVEQAMNVFVVLIGGIVALVMNIGYVSQVSLASIPFILVIVICTAIVKMLYSRYVIKVRKMQTEIQRKIDYNFEFRSNFDHAKEIRVEKINKLHEDAFSNSYEAVLRIVKKALRKSYILVVADDFLNGMLVKVLLLAVLASEALFRKSISVINVVVIYNATINVCNSFGSLLQTMITLDSASVHSDIYNDFIKYTNKMKSGSETITDISEIELRDVAFSYNGTDEVLKNVNVVIKKGMKVALVGRNGAGKSTLFKLLLRFYDPTAGKVLVDGCDIKEYDIQSYRELFSVLFQDVKTINASVEENISFGAPMDVGKIKKAIDEAGIADVIKGLPNKEKTNLGFELFEDGVELSGGQKQRLLLARAIYKNSSIILLDEPTAHVDMKNELEFFDAIYGKFVDKMVFFITHRLISAKNADLILVFDEQGIIETGNHKELMQKEGLYKEMYDIQLKNYEVGT